MRRTLFSLLLIGLVLLFIYTGIASGGLYPVDRLIGLVISPSTNLNDQSADLVEEITAELTKLPAPVFSTVRLITTGNIMAGQTQVNQAQTGQNQYDFSPSFEHIAAYLQTADLVIGDLEVSQACPDIVFRNYTGYTGWPRFNSPPELSAALYEAGVDIFTLANNHALDRGYEGLMMTIEHIRSLGANTFGAYKSQEERDSFLIREKNGISIAFIGYTFSTNNIPVPEGHDYCVNHTPYFRYITPILKDIQAARDRGVDFVAVFPHWGAEHTHVPQPQYLRQVAEEMASAGADLIIGGHPKWIQPIEWFFNETADGMERATLAIYSQGSFLTHQYEGDGHSSLYNEFGLLLDVELTKNIETGAAWISGVDYHITWVHRDWQHRVLLLSDIFDTPPEKYHLDESDVERMQAVNKTSIEVIEKYGHPEDMKRAMVISRIFFNQVHERYL